VATIGATIKIYDGFSNPLDKFSSGMDKAKRAMSGLKSSFKDGLNGNIQSPLNNIGQQAEKTSGIFKKMLGANIVGTGITRGIGLATSGIQSMMGELNEASTSWQTFDGNMRMLGDSPAQIESAKKSMQKFAQDTIYSASDMSQTYAQLAAVGTKNTDQLVKGFGGLASASENPQQAMKTLSQQATQAAAKPMIQWQDFKLMLEQTPAGMAAVAKTMGMSTKDLVTKVQDGNVATKDFFDAIAKTGTNDNFTKMATQYKTIGQAMDGLKETMANKMQNAFDRISKVGIKWVSDLTDNIGRVNFNSMADKALSAINTISKATGSIFDGFKNTDAISSVKRMFDDLGQAASNVFKGLSGGQDPFAFLKNVGKGAGSGIKTIANVIDSIAEAISKLSPGQIQGIATAIGALAGSMLLMKGLSGIGKIISGVSGPLSKLASAGKGLSGLSKLTAIAGKLTGLSGIGSSIAGLAGSLAAVAPVILGIAGALVVAGLAIYAFKTNLGGFGDFVTGVFSALSGPVSSIISTFSDVFGTLGEVFNSLKPYLMDIATIAGGILVAGLMIAAVAVAALADALKMLVNIAGAVVQALMGIGLSAKAAFEGVRGNFGQMKKDFGSAKDAFGKSGKSLASAFDFSDLATAKVFKTIGKINGLAEKNSSKKIKGPTIGTPKFEGSADPTKALEKKVSGKKIKGPQITQLDFSKGDPLNGLGKKVSKTKIKGPKVEPTFEGGDLIKQMQKKNSGKLKGPQIGQLNFSGGDPLQSLNKKVSTAKIKGPTVQKPKVQGGDPTADIKKKVSSSKIKGPTIQKPTVQGDPTSEIKKKVSSAKIPAPKVAKPKVPAVDTSSLSSARARINTQMNGIKSSISSSMRGAASAAKSGMAQVASAVRSGIQAAVAAGRSGASQMRSIGVMIGQGLAQGMQSQVGTVAAAANALVSQANKAARAKAQVHSPSRLFAEIGGFIGQGLAIGMDSTRSVVAKSGSALISAASGSNGSVKNPYSTGSGNRSNLLNSVTNSSNDNSNGKSSSIVIESGAIQINSTGNADYDGDRLLQIIENKLIEKQNASLS